jgi:ribonuclease P protein component
MERLRRRAEFLAAAGGRKVATAGFVLQALRRRNDGTIRVGFTVSRKVGTAVERNRVRRRLKDVVKRMAADALRPGHDYVLIGRRAALRLTFGRMIEEFIMALRRLESEAPPGRGPEAEARAEPRIAPGPRHASNRTRNETGR